MKLILRFLKPHWKTCLLTIVLMIVDVAGALFIPTLVADMLNQGTSGASFSAVVHTGIQMAVVSVLAGVCAVWGGYTCASLSARVGKDMREAIYAKSLKLSVYDFRQFGTASITTRTISDVTTIQFALISTIQMVIPVPVICVLALVMTFGLDAQMGLILLAVVAVVLLLACCIMRSASPLFRRLQKLLDRMSTVLLENLTGVRVVRAFNNEERETGRMTSAFSDHAGTSIKANRLFANLDGLSFFCINFFVVVVYWLSGARISAGVFRIGDITAVIEYAMLVLFFLMMAQMVILTLPRALECCERVRLVLDHSPRSWTWWTPTPRRIPPAGTCWPSGTCPSASRMRRRSIRRWPASIRRRASRRSKCSRTSPAWWRTGSSRAWPARCSPSSSRGSRPRKMWIKP